MVCLTSGEAIPEHPAPPGGKSPPQSSFPRVSSPPEGLPRLGFVLQWPLVPMNMHAKWGAHPRSFRGLVSNHPFVWGKALPTPNPMTHEDDSRAMKQHLDLCFWNPGPHMACMGQGPCLGVSDIRGGHSLTSSPPGGQIPPSEQFSQGFSTTRGPAQVGFRPAVATSTHVHACQMGGPSIHEASWAWCQTIPLFGARPSPPFIQ